MTTNSTTIATLASATASASAALYSTINCVVYSLNTGASSQSLTSVASGSGGFTFSQQISITNSTQYSISQGVTMEIEGLAGRTTRTTQYSISNTNYSFTTNQIATEFSGARFLDVPFTASFTPGAYWMLAGLTSSSASAGAAGLAAMTNCNVRFNGLYVNTMSNVQFGRMGSTNFTSIAANLGYGVFTTAGSTTTAGLPLSNFLSVASNVRLYFQMIRSA